MDLIWVGVELTGRRKFWRREERKNDSNITKLPKKTQDQFPNLDFLLKILQIMVKKHNATKNRIRIIQFMVK